MKLPNIKILEENNKLLRKKSEEVTFPLSNDDINHINDMIKYLEMSQNDYYIKKYDLRAGMGLAYVQTGILKRIFVIANQNDDNSFEEHIIINPKIISNSQEMIYVGEGEGCLSVNRPIEGVVPRYARVNIEYKDINGNKKNIRVREEIAIAFQHEIDHLDGILFVDKIEKDLNKLKNMREI